MTSSSLGGLPPSYPGLDESALAEKASNNSENSDDSGIVDYKDPKVRDIISNLPCCCCPVDEVHKLNKLSKSVVEQNRQMLLNQMSCDVTFIVGDKKEPIGAHKYVLMTRSVVFKHKFSGADGNSSEVIIKDIPEDCFWEMLKHIYCEEQKVHVTNVVGLLFAADQYNLLKLRQICLDYLHNCLEINNACYLLSETHIYGYQEEEKNILSYIRKNASKVYNTVGTYLLTRDLLNQILTLPGVEVEEDVKKDVLTRWANNQRKENKQETSVDNLMDSLQDCLYVYRDDSHCHRYIMDSLTTSTIFAEPPDPLLLPVNDAARTDESDGMSTLSTPTSLTSSVHTYSKLPSYNKWADFEQVTRFQELYSSSINDAKQPDAISFTVDHNIYLYGFSIYGPKKQGEGHYKIDAILTRKKRDIVMETISIKGAGVILPCMFERPVKIDKGLPYTLELYIKGPESHLGASGQSAVQQGTILFTFFDATKVKKSRSSLKQGQIPRLYYMPRNK
uniref:BTB domain-containing protein n=1 Tax=Biomphalaria glabrata TaxID=6526 RepID=A0A2C9KTZ7_BIOGL